MIYLAYITFFNVILLKFFEIKIFKYFFLAWPKVQYPAAQGTRQICTSGHLSIYFDDLKKIT